MDSMSVPIEFFNYEEMREHIIHGGLPPALANKSDKQLDKDVDDSMDDHKTLNTFSKRGEVDN